MKMEVLLRSPSPQKEFGFDRASPAMYSSVPSSPKPFGNQFDYFYDHASAPTSPTRAAAIYAHFSDFSDTNEDAKDDTDFAFDFNVQLEDGNATPGFVAADELFEAGRIRPLKLPPPLLRDGRSSSPRSPKGELGERGGEEGSIASLMAEARDRGRQKMPSNTLTRSRRASRSLSPLRGEADLHRSPNSSPSTAVASTAPQGGGSKRWRLRDLLLFRSASEGRATGRGSKDFLRKYSILSSNTPSSSLRRRPSMDNAKNGSFRSTAGRATKTGPAASAHEIHYAANRAASEEMKKKTPLPYHRHGLFGYLRFNPAVNSITRGLNGTLFSRNRA